MRFSKAVLSIIAGLLLSAVIAEAVLRALPVSMGLYRTNNQDFWPLFGYQSHERFSYSMTWQMLNANRGITNNYGQISPFDYRSDSKPVIVVGDSFVEALMNSFEGTLQGELGRALGPTVPVYGFGFSGNSLAEYLAVARMVKLEFSPRAMVFVIIDDDISMSWRNRIGHHYFQIDQGKVQEAYIPLDRAGAAKKIRQVVGDSALYRYVQVNLAFTLDGVIARRMRSNRESHQGESRDAERRSLTAAEYFLTTLPGASGLAAERVVLVFDSDRERIYQPSRAPRRGSDTSEVQEFFKARAIALGFKVIETGPIFAAHYKSHHQKFDYTPTDRHWNALGHQVVAMEVCRVIARESENRNRAVPTRDEQGIMRCKNSARPGQWQPGSSQ